MYCSQIRCFQNNGLINTRTGHMNSDEPERRIEAPTVEVGCKLTHLSYCYFAISSCKEGMNKYLTNIKNIQRVVRKLKVNGACLKEAFCRCGPRHHISPHRGDLLYAWLQRSRQTQPARPKQDCIYCRYFEKRGSGPHIVRFEAFSSRLNAPDPSERCHPTQ
jgi:hypothetical protein